MNFIGRYPNDWSCQLTLVSPRIQLQEMRCSGQSQVLTILPMQFFHLKIELAVTIENIKIDNVKVCDCSQKGTWDLSKRMEKAAIQRDHGEPGNDCHR